MRAHPLTPGRHDQGNLTHRPLLRRWLVGAVLALVFLLAAMLLSAAIGLELGSQVALLAVTVSVVPVGLVVPAILWLDRYEAEPPRLLVFAFAWGAVIAATVSLVLNTGSMRVLELVGVDAEAVGAVMVAPVVEESLKALGVLVIVWVHRQEFDGVIDGIVYAGLSAAGFAFAENILYFGRAFAEGGGHGLAAVFVVRGVLSPFAHPMFTMWFGVGVGVAATRRSAFLQVLAPLVGLATAMLLHGFWNLSSVAGLEGFWSSYLLLQVPIFAGAIVFVAWQRRREGRLIAAELGVYVPYGWLSPAEVTMLASLPQRGVARRWAGQVKGRAGKAAMIAFQDDATELALLRARMRRGAAGSPQQAQAQERALLHSLARCRSELV